MNWFDRKVDNGFMNNRNTQLNWKTRFLTWFLTFIFRPNPNTMCIVHLLNWWFSTLQVFMLKLLLFHLKYNQIPLNSLFCFCEHRVWDRLFIYCRNAKTFLRLSYFSGVFMHFSNNLAAFYKNICWLAFSRSTDLIFLPFLISEFFYCI